jgi:formate hydrogenlyase subunit 6/NADH:ubiquinone oxidoreductase subunit I
MGYIDNIRRAVTSTFEGMAVTMSWMFRRPMTIQYPDKIEVPVPDMLPEGWRGLLEVDVSVCGGCGLCSKTCPIGCIAFGLVKDAATGERRLARLDINAAKCMHCGLCTEVCPSGALRHTRYFEAANNRIENLVHRFVAGAPVPLYKIQKDVKPATRPLGEALLAARRPLVFGPGKPACSKEEK